MGEVETQTQRAQQVSNDVALPPAGVKTEFKKLRDEIGTAKGNGYQLDITPGLNVPRGDPAVTTYFESTKEWESPDGTGKEFKIFEASGPAEVLQKSVERQVPAVLTPFTKDTLTVSPFILEHEKTGDSYKFRVRDALNPASPLILEKIVPEKKLNTAAIEIREQLKGVFAERQGNYEQLLASIPSKEPSRTEAKAKLITSQELPATTKTTLRDVMGKTGLMHVAIMADSEYVERSVDYSSLLINGGFGNTLAITNSNVEKVEHPIQINGQVPLIQLERTLSEAPNYENAVENELGHIIPNDSGTSDRFGNVILRSFHPFPDGGGREQIRIIPPFKFRESAGDELFPLNIDLSHIGENNTPKVLEGLLLINPGDPIQSDGRYAIQSNMDPKTVREQYGNEFDSLYKGVEEVEQRFGLSPGERVKHIYILKAAEAQARFLKASPDTIVLNNDILKHKGQEQLIARHEATHAMALQVENQPNDAAAKPLAEIHAHLPKKFFDQLDESEFYKGELPISARQNTLQAGHSADNVGELWATSINSLFHPRWESKMVTSTPEFRDNYELTLRALQETTRLSTGLRADAPIHQVLQDRLGFLQMMRHGRPIGR